MQSLFRVKSIIMHIDLFLTHQNAFPFNESTNSTQLAFTSLRFKSGAILFFARTSTLDILQLRCMRCCLRLQRRCPILSCGIHLLSTQGTDADLSLLPSWVHISDSLIIIGLVLIVVRERRFQHECLFKECFLSDYLIAQTGSTTFT